MHNSNVVGEALQAISGNYPIKMKEGMKVTIPQLDDDGLLKLAAMRNDVPDSKVLIRRSGTNITINVFFKEEEWKKAMAQ